MYLYDNNSRCQSAATTAGLYVHVNSIIWFPEFKKSFKLLSIMFSCKHLSVRFPSKAFRINGNFPLEQIRVEFIHGTEKLTFIAAMSLSYDSLIFFITSSSALEHASMAPFTVMVRSGLYKVRSWRLDKAIVVAWKQLSQYMYVMTTMQRRQH